MRIAGRGRHAMLSSLNALTGAGIATRGIVLDRMSTIGAFPSSFNSRGSPRGGSSGSRDGASKGSSRRASRTSKTEGGRGRKERHRGHRGGRSPMCSCERTYNQTYGNTVE